MHRPLTIACAFGAVVLSAPFAAAAPISWNTLSGTAPVIIGHRGAPAYLPENSLGGNELAAEMGADIVETDVMLTADDKLVVMHDETLERTTDVEDRFAPRGADGVYYVSDFTLAEIRTLTVEPTGGAGLAYPGFVPSMTAPYRVPTLAEMLDEIDAYNVANGTDLGILTEVKGSYSPLASRLVVETMIDKGFTTEAMNGAAQSFDFENVFEMAGLIASAGADIDVFQLGGAALVGGEWYVALTETNARPLNLLATYVDGIAIYEPYLSESLIDTAHRLGLEVYGWTFRPSDLAAAQTMAASFLDWGLDGYITDNPDLIGAAVDLHGVAPVPLPAGMPLLLAGLGGLCGVARSRRRT
ncbi:glycerophosphoryl diester phosphodiesterase [Rhodovulum sp. ES.010]|uniref:glycerophosphodiester phosphodiesterase family protein n=1 Tax=Rhodovulum sp. ES.010 TaxID=1882821 RepID=UPI00092A3521|nr:glycerophosphodiester phosphodiesterase family protein [Rhodovulum sp. ES.010]SIO53726.1 glycerophosphoryl diester phosphodiesterase [Rhodovulum sp. ES.010]